MRNLLAVIIVTSGFLGNAQASETYIEGEIDEVREAASTQGKAGSWVPVPIPMSNPTLGTGLQGGVLYLHPDSQEGSGAPANVTSGLGGMYTDSKSWMLGLFHDGNWAEGTYRYRAFIGMGEFNLKFSGIGGDLSLADNPIPYNMRVWGLGGRLQRRLPGTENWYAGFRYLYTDSEISFEWSRLGPRVPDLSVPFTNAGLGLVLSYDSRDDSYYPQSGQLFESSLVDYGAAWGGNFEYTRVNAAYNHFLAFRPDTTLALRANLQSVDGKAPFFDLPYLNMRGFSRDRYRDENSLSLHAEIRHKFKPRWGAVAFAESGWIADELSALLDANTVTSTGVGLRWQATEEKALHLGVDLAFSEGDVVSYIRVGEMF